MKRNLACVLSLAMAACFLGCKTGTPEEPPVDAAKPVIQAQSPAIAVLSDEKPAELVFSASSEDGDIAYSWYECADLSGSSPVKLADSNTSVLSVSFSQNKIKYFYCEAVNFIVDNGDGGVKSSVLKSPVYVVARTGLPLLELTTACSTAAITREAYAQGRMRLSIPGEEPFSYEFEKPKEGVKGRGNSSWTFPKKGYNIKFDKKQSLFALEKSKKWCIIANYSDKSLLRNKLASVLATKVFNKEWNPSFYSVDVVMNGVYQGNYILGEKIAIGKGRVDITDISDAAVLQDGGFILEVDGRKDAEFYYQSSHNWSFCLKDPDSVQEEAWDYVKQKIQAAEDALYAEGFDASDSQNDWMNYIDAESVADWFLVNELAKNRDARGFSSIYLYCKPEDGKFHFGPVWDFDIGFGNDGETACGNPEGWYIALPGGIISRMFEDARFVQMVKDRWEEKKDDVLEVMNELLPQLADEISVSAELNFIRWPILGSYVWPNPAGYAERKSPQSEVELLSSWLNDRYSFICQNIASL